MKPMNRREVNFYGLMVKGQGGMKKQIKKLDVKRTIFTEKVLRC